MNKQKKYIIIAIVSIVLLAALWVIYRAKTTEDADVARILDTQSALDLGELYEPYQDIDSDGPIVELAEGFTGDSAEIHMLADEIADLSGISTNAQVTTVGEPSGSSRDHEKIEPLPAFE